MINFSTGVEHKIIHAIMTSQLALNKNEDLRYSAPSVFKKTLKQKTSTYLEELIKSEKDFDLLFEKEESSLKQVYDVLEKFVDIMSKVPIWEMENVSEVIKAYFKDRSSIEGIVKKINR